MDSYDYIIIGSGFGGSVSALRLSEKGYKVLVVEKGRRFRPEDFSEGTSKLRSWLWNPKLGLRGIMKLSTLRHVNVMSGVGVGGGSLVYGATLPTPKDAFFTSGSWGQLCDWKSALSEHYDTALTMLGATKNPRLAKADLVLKDVATALGREDTFEATRVGIYFGDKDKAGQPVSDPYFDGEGPARRGCTQCGDCMTGCRYNAKNSLDKNYLYLAEKRGATVLPDTEVIDVRPAGTADGSDGYFVTVKNGGRRKVLFANGVVFSGGVMGTVPLLLKLREKGSLPKLSHRLGDDIRTNNESLTSVVATGDNPQYNDGVTIGSIFHPDEYSHLEPIRLGPKSGLWRFLMVPMATGKNLPRRLASLMSNVVTSPMQTAKAWLARQFGERTITLLFMQHLDSTVRFRRGRFGRLYSSLAPGEIAPSADIPMANELAEKTAQITGGKTMRFAGEVFLGAPATAHVLGGAVMGHDADSGVIDANNRVFNYRNMYVCDGSMISANPGVNPSLTITAVTEHAMSHIAATPEASAQIRYARGAA